MIIFLNLKNQIIEGENSFAFYNTINDRIVSFDNVEVFDSISEFNDFTFGISNEIKNRYLELIPKDYFNNEK